MILPYSLILDALTDYGVQYLSGTALPDELYLARPVFASADYDAGSTVSSRALLLEGKPFSVRIQETGSALPVTPMLPVHVLQVTAGPSLDRISNQLHALFNLWESWESELQQLALRGVDLSQYLELTEQLTGNALEVMGSEFLLIGFSSAFRKLLMESGYQAYDSLTAGQLLPPVVVNALKKSPDYLDSQKETGSFFSGISPLPERPVMCSNIFYKGSYVARLIMYEGDMPFRPWHTFVMEKLTEVLTPVYFEHAGRYSANTRRCGQLLNQLIDRGNLNQNEQIELLGLAGWAEDETLLLAAFMLGQEDRDIRTDAYYSRQLAFTFPGSVSATYQGWLILVTALSQYGNSDRRLRTQLSEYAGENHFAVGIGNLFSQFSSIPEAFRQACTAVHYGLKSSSAATVFSFSDFALPYILEKCQEDMDVCAPQLQVLKQYDAEHKTQLYETLKCFLRNNQNAVHTAKALFIQRNTLLYRLRRVQTLTALDLGDYRTTKYIELSFLIEDSRW